MYIQQSEIWSNIRKRFNDFLNALSSVVLYCDKNCLHNNKTPIFSLPLTISVEILKLKSWLNQISKYILLSPRDWLLLPYMSTEGVTLPLADVCRTPFLHRLNANTAPTEQSCWRALGSTNVPPSGVGEFFIIRNVKSLLEIFFCCVSGADINYRN
jgi:hypothetical protein